MSGHSKWSTIKHKKGAADAKRGRVFTKLIREIAMAAKQGGGAPESNPRLRKAIDDAKAVNMPADNIKRAVQRGTGELPGVSYEEVTFEGYGPGGTAILIEALTDNKNRTLPEIRTIFSKNGGNLGASGSVSHGFERMGLIEYPASAGDADKLLEAAIEAGADDVESDEDGHRIWTSVEGLHEVAKALEPMIGEAESAKLAWRPQTDVEVRGDDAQRLANLMEALEEDDDVQTVWGNERVPDEELANLA
jgi:YebC/PmpR family DNA-binding regulatory protein